MHCGAPYPYMLLCINELPINFAHTIVADSIEGIRKNGSGEVI